MWFASNMWTRNTRRTFCSDYEKAELSTTVPPKMADLCKNRVWLRLCLKAQCSQRHTRAGMARTSVRKSMEWPNIILRSKVRSDQRTASESFDGNDLWNEGVTFSTSLALSLRQTDVVFLDAKDERVQIEWWDLMSDDAYMSQRICRDTPINISKCLHQKRRLIHNID